MRITKDPILERILVYNPARQNRPEEKKDQISCPFCPENEDKTPTAVLYLPDKEWKVKVIPNKFPILPEHEVIVHTPYHNKQIWELSEEEVFLIFKAHILRTKYYKDKHRTKNLAVLSYANYGPVAGASILHSHSQLIVLNSDLNPKFPPIQPINNVVEENEFFLSYCPEYSEYPYEIWIKPRIAKYFEDSSEEELFSFAKMVKSYVLKIFKLHKYTHQFKLEFSFNWYITPTNPWYFRLLPRFTILGGLEMASNIRVNPIYPEEAAKHYKIKLEAVTEILEKLRKEIEF